VACLLLAGCGALGGTPATPTATPSPQELVAQISAATQAADTFTFTMDFAGAPVYADPDSRLFALVSVEGQLRRPDAARASIRVRNVGAVAEIRLVSLEGQLYATNPLTREWNCFPPGALFDPVVLFDPERGVDYLISEEFEDITLEGIAELDDSSEPHYHLSGTIAGPPLREISYGLVGAGDVEVDVWAEVDTQQVRRIVLLDSASDPQNPTTWTMDITGYDEEVDIRAPIECPAD
jgi:lipoprotein LprG